MIETIQDPWRSPTNLVTQRLKVTHDVTGWKDKGSKFIYVYGSYMSLDLYMKIVWWFQTCLNLHPCGSEVGIVSPSGWHMFTRWGVNVGAPKPLQTKVFSNQNKGHLGSRCINIYIYTWSPFSLHFVVTSPLKGWCSFVSYQNHGSLARCQVYTLQQT